MARRNRFCPAHVTYHVVNRGNDRRVIFQDDAEYSSFLKLLAEGQRKAPVHLFGYCGMPTHFHLLVRPQTDTALSAYMQWVTGRYACDLRRITKTVGHGHVFQRRFWSVPVGGRLAFLSVLRYIEANPVRARLVTQAESWQWSSYTDRARGGGLVRPLPFPLPEPWSNFVNTPQGEGILRRIRESLLPRQGRPCARLQSRTGLETPPEA